MGAWPPPCFACFQAEYCRCDVHLHVQIPMIRYCCFTCDSISVSSIGFKTKVVAATVDIPIRDDLDLVQKVLSVHHINHGIWFVKSNNLQVNRPIFFFSFLVEVCWMQDANQMIWFELAEDAVFWTSVQESTWTKKSVSVFLVGEETDSIWSYRDDLLRKMTMNPGDLLHSIAS